MALTHNIGWKLASLALAIAIWASIHSVNDTDRRDSELTFGAEKRTFVLPITIMTSAEDPRSFLVNPANVSVTASGPGDSLAELDASDLLAFVNLTDVKDARDLRKRILVRTPPGITTLRIDPPEVTIQRANPVPSDNP